MGYKDGLKYLAWAPALLLPHPRPAAAQIPFPGITWEQVKDPDFLLQLESASKQFATYPWDTLKDGVPYAANQCGYTVQGASDGPDKASHAFTIHSGCMRSEMKVQMRHAYEPDGSYQFEGEVRFIPGQMEKAHIICQIWQNLVVSTNKVLVLHAQPDAGGTLAIPGASDRVGTFKGMTNVFNDYNSANGKWLRVNVTHFRAKRKVFVHFGGTVYDEYVHGASDGEYYFKFGVYGSVGPAALEWRNVKMFRGSTGPLGARDATARGAAHAKLVPSSSGTKIAYALGERSPVAIALNDLAGRRLAVIAEGMRDPGAYEEGIEAAALPAGLYLIEFETRGSKQILKWIR